MDSTKDNLARTTGMTTKRGIADKKQLSKPTESRFGTSSRAMVQKKQSNTAGESTGKMADPSSSAGEPSKV